MQGCSTSTPSPSPLSAIRSSNWPRSLCSRPCTTIRLFLRSLLRRWGRMFAFVWVWSLRSLDWRHFWVRWPLSSTVWMKSSCPKWHTVSDWCRADPGSQRRSRGCRYSWLDAAEEITWYHLFLVWVLRVVPYVKPAWAVLRAPKRLPCWVDAPIYGGWGPILRS